MTPNVVTDLLPSSLRFALTGIPRTRKAQAAFVAEIEATHDAGYSVMYLPEHGWGWFARTEGGPPDRWTAHGWCGGCQTLLDALPPLDVYLANLPIPETED